MATDWTDEENDEIVADYFAMLANEVVGQPYNKAQRNRELQQRIGRGRESIEFKHRNVSAVLQGLGEEWITGYKPAANFQTSLVEAVNRWLAQHREWFSRPPRASLASTSHSVREEATLWIGPPPTHSNTPPPKELEQMLAIARRFNVAERDAHNRTLGLAGEKRVLSHERSTLLAAGRVDLANRVRWVSQLDGDGAGFDIASFDTNGRDRLIEVKTTNGWERTPFYITCNELAVSRARRANWHLVRLWNFSREPRAFELRPPLEPHVQLMAIAYQASFS